ncbi:uberolysin/carnocyclin family circular bacteriocin [Paenibacillus woosongensis]|uniref:Circular bacteriocin, circularin A/uberolysin family n=1 Tax=Paenibacillus woosongensis TaxID=307580 RepID=A0A7X2Z5D4_9BACL|nr:uberolysin/carnocyclin family circular bacteriocin [Paenibacillus woosongensis]MUG47896.1 circular bacteriocin, circularin A/uberolysin family [Paenibacillus woosongensis]
MFDIMAYLSIDKSLATQIVNLIDTFGYAAIAVSAIMTLLSAGSLAVTSVMIDAAILYVKDLLKKNLKAQAIAW